MFNKKILVITSLAVVLVLVTILFSNNDKKNVFTRLVMINDGRNANYVDNNLEVVEESTTKKDDNADVVYNEEAVMASIEEDIADKPEIVYDGMTLDELASKLEKSLKNELSGKGYLYASYSLEKGVDPYLAVAISLEETGCNNKCSKLVRNCNNVGGMKGKGCGSYGSFNTLDDGIKSFINNIYKNYVVYGLTTAETMNPKYAANPNWSNNVNKYIRSIKSK